MEVNVDLGRAAAGLRGERQEGSGEDKEAGPENAAERKLEESAGQGRAFVVLFLNPSNLRCV